MTCIVGLVDQGRVFIGADSAGVAGADLAVRRDRKVFVNGGFLIGFSASFRMGQLLRYALLPPHPPKRCDLFAFMVTDFVDALRETMAAGGAFGKDDGADSVGVFLVGCAGRLFKIDSDYQVAEHLLPFDACGEGYQVALGNLLATAGQPPPARVAMALEAAEQFCSTVRRPFHVEMLEAK